MPRTGRPRQQPATCTVEGCPRAAYAKTLCRMHYMRMHKTGDPGEADTRQRDVCTIAGCGEPHASKGYCTRHYRRFLRYGSAQPEVEGPRKHGTSPFAHGNRKYAEGTTCSVEACGRKPKAKGLCAGHYQRMQATGDVGASDFRRHGSGRSIDSNGYVVLKWGAIRRPETS
jgi:hypothetical protein